MDYAGKRVLIVGLARSGMAAAKALNSRGARILANDIKTEGQMKEEAEQLRALGAELYLGIKPDELVEQVDLLVISPAVPIWSTFVQKALSLGKEVISEVELAYRLCKAAIVAITGTNGKTTTTSLVGEIFKEAGKTTHVVGNIGTPFVGKVDEIGEKDIVVAEISSFQLEAVSQFHPKVCAILNITEDHMDRHKTMENYINTKMRIFKNSTYNDWVVLNGDDPETVKLKEKTKAKVLFFSRKRTLEQGAWVEEGQVMVDVGQGKERVCDVDDIFIPGSHNLENALAATLMARLMGVSPGSIASTLKTFRGVEHRIELVDTIDGINFYNDSKGTNPDASIKAIQAMKGPTVLIAGGYDKGGSFSSFIDAFGNTISHMVVLGQTADKLIRAAQEKGFMNVHRVKTLDEAVIKAFSLATPGGNVLLSPACASWDMFKDYEERGRMFKEAVKALREEKR